VVAICIFPFIIVEDKTLKHDKTFINHELIHFYQQMELFFIPFVFIYYTEFLIRFIQYKDVQIAYRNISFEREAYQNEADYEYLKIRKWFSFIKYWKNGKIFDE
jgi:hypothetical protein